MSQLKQAFAIVLFTTSLHAQTASDWTQRLVGHPLYLRDAWSEDKLEFNALGEPVNDAHHGSLTLSGIDITDVKLSHDQMQLRGQRVVLFAPGPGQPLQRTAAINSTTQMPLTHARQYKANEPVQVTIHADQQGSFDAAIAHIFANGLAQLATSVPSYWSCYAAAYFVDGPVAETAPRDVLHCAETESNHPFSNPSGRAETQPPAVLQSAPITVTHQAAELHLAGKATVYATISARGLPIEFQVITPVGAGVDEVVLQAVSRFTFQPATLDGKPISAGFQFSISLGN